MMDNNYYLNGFNNRLIKFRPKAIVCRTIPSELKNETCQILSNYGPLSILQFPIIYKYIFERIFPIDRLGFDDGLFGYFKELQDIINLKRVGSNYVASLKDANYFDNSLNIDKELISSNNIEQRRSILRWKRFQEVEEQYKILFDPDDNRILWKDWSHLLEIYPIVLVKSPYQKELENYSNNHRIFTESILNLRTFMSQNPQGVRLNELNNYIRIDKRLYNNSSTECVIKSWPEVFFINDEDDNTNPLVYDGHTRTYDLNKWFDSARNCSQTNQSPESIAMNLIRKGLYQKTLILLYEAGSEGLRLAVWKECLRLNFHSNEKLFDSLDILAMINDLKPIKIFNALHAVGLVRLESDKYSKNDIRIHLPSQDFSDAFYRLIKKLKHNEEVKKARKNTLILIERNCNSQLNN